jgi:hypothetical protein
MFHLRRFVLITWLAAFLTSRAFGWGASGHSFLTQNSVGHLPASLQSFVNRYFTTISTYATNEPPGQHYIDIDVYPEFLAGQMPRDLNVLYATYGASYVNSNGISPWVIANYRATLTSQMRTAASDADYLALAQTAGEMAHYIEDINQPLHTTYNYDGQYTGNSGIHSRYETTMVNRNFAGLSINPAPQNCVYVTNTVDWVLDTIETRTWGYVDDIMAADTLAKTFGTTSSNAYYNSLWSSTGAFTHSQFQLATEMVASAWYSAWVDAGSPALGVLGDYNNNGTVDAADYVVWRKNLNTTAPLPNDVTAGVTAADFTVWRINFGKTLVAGSGVAFTRAVPEPPTIVPLLSMIAIVSLWSVRRVVGATGSARLSLPKSASAL